MIFVCHCVSNTIQAYPSVLPRLVHGPLFRLRTVHPTRLLFTGVAWPVLCNLSCPFPGDRPERIPPFIPGIFFCPQDWNNNIPFSSFFSQRLKLPACGQFFYTPLNYSFASPAFLFKPPKRGVWPTATHPWSEVSFPPEEVDRGGVPRPVYRVASLKIILCTLISFGTPELPRFEAGNPRSWLHGCRPDTCGPWIRFLALLSTICFDGPQLIKGLCWLN